MFVYLFDIQIYKYMNNFVRSYKIILHHLQELQIDTILFKQVDKLN